MKNTQAMNISKALSMLEEATNLISKSLDFVPKNSKGLKFGFHFQEAGHALTTILELEINLWNLEPGLVPEYMRPNFEYNDLSLDIEELASDYEMEQQQGIKAMELYMPKDVFEKFNAKDATIGKYDFAKQWWEGQERPYIPKHYMARLLNHEHLYMRYHAAKQIEAKYGVILWNDQENALDTDAVQKWFDNENIDI